MRKVANRHVRDFGREIAHAAVTRRPPIPLDTIVPRTAGSAYDVGVWNLPIVQGAMLCRAVPNPNSFGRDLFASLCHLRQRRRGSARVRRRPLRRHLEFN
jgi:hypothetical protein